MNTFISIAARILLMAFAVIAVFAVQANSGPLDERFKVSLNTVIQNVKETQDPAAKREKLGNFLTKMDQGIGMARSTASENDAQALHVLQMKMQADYAELNGHGTAKVSDADLNAFAVYVQQDMEQARGGIFISGCCLIILLILLILFLR